MTPTAEQLAIITAARDTPDNLLVSALAGAAKTTTLVLIAEALPKTETLCLAFNKRIADEMQQRLPANCQAKTLNGLGHGAWSKTLGRFCKLDTGKVYRLTREFIDTTLTGEDVAAAYESFADIMQAVRAGKTSGYIPSGSYTNARRLLDDDEFFATLDEAPTELERGIIRAVSRASLDEAWKGVIDFDDQLLMPTVFQAVFPRFPLVMVDEAQDLSALNHAMLRKLARRRLIAVGDECQSIYGFRGAHENSMTVLRKTFDMRPLSLSISFRCPVEVVKEARWRAPHMTYPDAAKAGAVTHLPRWSVADLPENDTAIICRNNAPLFSLAIRLLKAGRYPQIVGADIGKALIRQMKKLGSPSMNRESTFAAIAQWEEAKLVKARDHGKVRDQAECMRIFVGEAGTLGDAIIYLDHLLSSTGPIQLLTGHKSKGLEYENVFILDRHLVRLDKHQQEKNLMYVMITRAKSSLTYITSEGYHE